MSATDHNSQTRLVEQLFVKHVSSIRGFIEAFLHDFNRADDVLQETFLTVAAKAGDYREGSDFLAWALTIAKYKVFESLRQPRAKVGTLSPEVIEVLAASAPRGNEEDGSRMFLRDCMEELPPRAKEVIELRYGETCKPAEIARRLQWTPESVYVALSRARALLRDCIELKAKQQEYR